MAYNIQYKGSVRKDLDRLGRAEAKQVLDKIEKQSSLSPERYPALKGRFAGLRKMRMGDYRVVYAIVGQDVLVLRIGHRRNVYE